MKLYRVEADHEIRQWVGSMAEIAKLKREYVQQGFKRSAIIEEEVEIPTDKKGLIGFLNQYNV